jgi:hypothetical protein
MLPFSCSSFKPTSAVNRSSRSLARILVACMLAASGATLAPASATEPSAATATTTDKTASVSLPAGWTLAKGSQGFIYVTGPHDERINLGVIAIGKNASSIGSNPGGAIAFALPYSASLKTKFTAILQGGAAKQGAPAPQIAFASQTPTKLPMCTLFAGGWTAGADSRKFEAVLCSLAPDYLGLYKNLVFLAQVPASLATQDRPIVEKIVGTYRVTPDMFKKMLAPYTPAPPRPAGGAAVAAPGLAPYQDPTNSDCFDYNVIRESPPWEVPMHCGGHMAD